MKSTFSDGLLVILMPAVVGLDLMKDWIAVLVGILSSIWIVVQLIWRIKNWNEKNKTLKPLLVIVEVFFCVKFKKETKLTDYL